MSDSEHSTVTYTSVSEDDSDIGSPGVDGPPIMPENSPTHQSPGYIPESDPEEDPEEDDEEDPEEDPADYPADRGDDRDDEESSDDDDDAEEEEHLAPADHTAVAYSADQDPYLAYRVTARMSIRPQAPAPFLSEEIPSPPLPISSPPPNGPTYVERSMGSRAAGIRQRDALPSPIHETEMPEICLPLRKRPCRTTPGPGYEVGESFGSGTERQVDRHARAAFMDLMIMMPSRRCTDHLRAGSSENRALLRARVNMLYRDRLFHRRTTLLIEEEARLSRVAWAQSMDACDQVHSEGISLWTYVSQAQQSRSLSCRQQTVGDRRDFRSAESRLSETETVSGDTKDSEEPQDSDDRASETAGTC
ncbi:hypothetical protein Tco_1314121 [Tanacetum coccineum]